MAKSFQLRRLRGGRRHVQVFDSPADYLRCLADEMAGDFNVRCNLSVTESTDGWLLVEARCATPDEIASPGAAGSPETGWLSPEVRSERWRFAEFCDELSHVFSRFYDCGAVTRGPAWRAWRVRHRDGYPWI